MVTASDEPQAEVQCLQYSKTARQKKENVKHAQAIRNKYTIYVDIGCDSNCFDADKIERENEGKLLK